MYLSLFFLLIDTSSLSNVEFFDFFFGGSVIDMMTESDVGL